MTTKSSRTANESGQAEIAQLHKQVDAVYKWLHQKIAECDRLHTDIAGLLDELTEERQQRIEANADLLAMVLALGLDADDMDDLPQKAAEHEAEGSAACQARDEKCRALQWNYDEAMLQYDMAQKRACEAEEKLARGAQTHAQLLTEADRLAPFFKWSVGGDGTPLFTWPLPNVWLGVSVENQAAADERIPLLVQVPAAVKFVSCEPLLGEVKLTDDVGTWFSGEYASFGGYHGIDWLIVGGESGPGARPMHPDWARGLRDQCQQAGVPFFMKQWGRWVDYHNAPAETRCLIDEGKYYDGYAGFPDQWNVFAVGKKAAGRLLDGREWNEMPEVDR